MELFGLNERVIQEAKSKEKKTELGKNQVFMHWNSGFCEQSQCYYVHTDEDCENYLLGEKCRVSKCTDIQGQTGTNRDKQGQRGTEMDRQGQAWTDRARKGQTWTDRDRKGQAGTSREIKGLSLFVPACPCLSLPCHCFHFFFYIFWIFDDFWQLLNF